MRRISGQKCIPIASLTLTSLVYHNRCPFPYYSCIYVLFICQRGQMKLAANAAAATITPLPAIVNFLLYFLLLHSMFVFTPSLQLEISGPDIQQTATVGSEGGKEEEGIIHFSSPENSASFYFLHCINVCSVHLRSGLDGPSGVGPTQKKSPVKNVQTRKS